MEKKKKSATIKAHAKKLSLATTEKQKTNEYEHDFYKWSHTQVNLLKKKEFSKLDMENLIEEIENLGKSEKRTLMSYLEILLMHKLKVKFQPEMHTASWDASIKEADFKVKETLSDNPSLKPKLNEILTKAYYTARLKAVIETRLSESVFPEKCPWKLKEIFPDLEKKYC